MFRALALRQRESKSCGLYVVHKVNSGATPFTNTTFTFQISRIFRTLAPSRCLPADKETLETRLVCQAVIQAT